MSRSVRISVAVLVTIIVTVGLGALSQVPYEPDTADHAVVRLAWRVRSVRVEECRRLTEDELQGVPTHMRREEVCEGRVLPYRLIVSLDGTPLVDDVVRAAGAREDRPLFVNYEVPVEPGALDLSVRFARQGDAPQDTASVESTPAVLMLEQRIELGSKDVALVTYDAGARSLVIVGTDTVPPR